MTDPMLSSLGHFGGGTATVLPLAGSPTINNDSTPGFGCPPLDQRGYSRPDSPTTIRDCGAVERQQGDVDPLFIDGFESGTTSAWGL